MPTHWSNWAGDQRCIPAAIERPGTRNELIEAIARAADRGRKVRAAASGHSFTDIACTEGVMVRLERLDRVLDVDRGSGLVRVEGGISVGHLAEALDAHGLALENQGDIDRQTLAGAISTATHGTGSRFRNMSSQVESVELVLADGSVAERDSGRSESSTRSPCAPSRRSRSGASTVRPRSRRPLPGSTS
jgi:FAD/FMN-containing dehydrogenase